MLKPPRWNCDDHRPNDSPANVLPKRIQHLCLRTQRDFNVRSLFWQLHLLASVKSIYLHGCLDISISSCQSSRAYPRGDCDLRGREFVVGGCIPNGNLLDALLVGYFVGRDLIYAASVRGVSRRSSTGYALAWRADTDTTLPLEIASISKKPTFVTLRIPERPRF